MQVQHRIPSGTLVTLLACLTTALSSPLLLASFGAQAPGCEDLSKGRPSTRIDPHGRHALPPIEIDEQNNRVRVDTPDGPVWIRTCVPPGPDRIFEQDPRGGAVRRRAAGLPPDPLGTQLNSSPPPPGMVVTPGTPQSPIGPSGYPGCLRCHEFIENASQNMFGMNLDCVFCHGGDPYGKTKQQSHVQSNGAALMDKTVPPFDDDLEYQRFLNPSNLRVADQSCSLCHGTIVSDVTKNMMSTTAGHFAGGLYLNNVVDTKTPIYGNKDVVDADGYVPLAEGAVASLIELLEYDPTADQSLYSTHYAAVPAQACARCHLWSRGKGYRGAVGAEGTYRADGCAACHMPYANDGLSQSADTAIDHSEPGHPISHILTRKVPTSQCLHCHHRGARIGLSFTGRAQMPPRLPSGPGVAGTTDEKFNGNYHYAVSDTNPQDVHNELGLNCIDCHTKGGIMGDGNIWGHMDQATKIECRSCHGMPNQAPTLADNDGGILNNMSVDQGTGDVVLTSKIDGQPHITPVLMDFLDSQSQSYNPTAAAAMNHHHLKDDGGLECYACHSSWVPNCYGCHFERDERFMGQNLVTGNYEVGKVTTNNKIFEALRQFSYGPNSEGRAAPYLVACQPIADVTAPDGTKKLDYKMPVTSNGLSGLALNPVNPHTVRSVGEVRTCVECHRTPAALGMGSGNYSIARDKVFLATTSHTESFDRKASPSAPAHESPLVGSAQAYALASRPNVVEGVADYLFAAEGPAGVRVFDRRPGQGTTATLISGIFAIDVSRAARYLFVVDRGVGVKIYDNDDPLVATQVSNLVIPTAERAVPFGIHLFVAAGAAGLYIVDISDHANPVVIANLAGMNAADVELYSHFQQGSDFAVRAYVADPSFGVHVVDLLPDYDAAQVVGGLALPGAAGLDAYSRYVNASGAEPSREHDYLYVAAGAAGLQVYDMTLPDAIVAVGPPVALGGAAADVVVASQLAPPGVDDYAYVANTTTGLQVVDVTDPKNPTVVSGAGGPSGGSRVLVEVQQMDRFLDEQGNQLKENSHPFTDFYSRADIVRLLSVTIP